MKLFAIAAIIALSSAARLELLEQQKNLRKYLPPIQNGLNGNGGVPSNSGTNGINGAGQPSLENRGSFPSASTKYIPPINGLFTSSVAPEFADSLSGFAQKLPGPLGSDPIGVPAEATSPLDSSPLGSDPLVAQVKPEENGHHSSQDIPQQAFDEKTGYQY